MVVFEDRAFSDLDGDREYKDGEPYRGNEDHGHNVELKKLGDPIACID